MKGLLLVTHSNMCQGIKESCEMIVGNQNNMKTCLLYTSDAADEL